MSHGASGIAVALLELYAETGRDLFLEAARSAFAYEDSLFDQSLSNWPDLRAVDELGRAPTNPSFGQAWCHGAPGIALARIRAAALDRERAETHLGWARVAITTTLRAIDDNLQRARHDASLCHGLAGLMDIALTVGRSLADRDCLVKGAEVATVLTSRHARMGDYPSGLVSGAVTPTLMLGLAGTGHAFLRLHAPDRVPSILLLGLCDAAPPS
jgi:lantibiotic modifying enzyme